MPPPFGRRKLAFANRRDQEGSVQVLRRNPLQEGGIVVSNLDWDSSLLVLLKRRKDKGIDWCSKVNSLGSYNTRIGQVW